MILRQIIQENLLAYKHDYDKTLTRLNTIIARLNDGESLSVKELAEEFNVSIRTIQRDFNEKLVGLYPIYQDKRKWKMQDGYKIEKTSSIEDTIVLDILERFSDGLGSHFSVIAKTLLRKIKNETFNPIYAKLNMEDISTHIQEIIILEKAITSKNEIKCIYKNVSYYTRLIPLKIANFEGYWYLIALDAKNNKLKKYHLKSINKISILDKKFAISGNLDKLLENAINVWFNPDTEPFEVSLFLEKSAAVIIKRKPISNSQRIIKEYQDGACDISVQITHYREILPIIQYWMPYIKVISPKSLQEKIMKNIKEFIS